MSTPTSLDWVTLTGEEESEGDGDVEGPCGRGVQFARGKHPRGVVLFKNSQRMCRESKSDSSEDHLFVFENDLVFHQ